MVATQKREAETAETETEEQSTRERQPPKRVLIGRLSLVGVLISFFYVVFPSTPILCRTCYLHPLWWTFWTCSMYILSCVGGWVWRLHIIADFNHTLYKLLLAVTLHPGFVAIVKCIFTPLCFSYVTRTRFSWFAES